MYYNEQNHVQAFIVKIAAMYSVISEFNAYGGEWQLTLSYW